MVTIVKEMSVSIPLCRYAQNTALAWNGTVLRRGEEIVEERFTIVLPFRKQMSGAHNAAVIDQLKELFGLHKLGVHITPSEIRRTLHVLQSSLGFSQSMISDMSAEVSSSSSLATDTQSASSVEWSVPSTSSFAVIARRPLPEGHVDTDIAQYLKETASIAPEICRQLCNMTCFRWLLGNSMKKVADGKMFLRRVATTCGQHQPDFAVEDAIQVHLNPYETQEALFDETCSWESFMGSFCYRIFVLEGRTRGGSTVLNLHDKCELHSRRLEYMTSLLESINESGVEWDMSRLIFEWRRRIEAVCVSIHPSMLWVGNFVMRRITEHLQSVDYGAREYDDEEEEE